MKIIPFVPQEKNVLYLTEKPMIARCEAKKYINTDSSQVPHDANISTAIRKAKVSLFLDNRKTQVRFQRGSRDKSSNTSPNKTVRNTYDSLVFLSCTYNHFYTLFSPYDQPQEPRLA